jgi:hypothetical protein
VRRWLQTRAMPAEYASRCKRVGHVGPGQEPACVRCVPVPRSKWEHGGVCAQKVRETQHVGGWVAALGQV